MEIRSGRFADPAILIMSSLAEKPRHGHALIQDIEAFAGVTLGPGTLYGALARLEEGGLIEATAADGRRRPYQLTQAGLEVLKAYLTHSHRVAEIGLRRLATQ